jgi:hypothetical protein
MRDKKPRDKRAQLIPVVLQLPERHVQERVFGPVRLHVDVPQPPLLVAQALIGVQLAPVTDS